MATWRRLRLFLPVPLLAVTGHVWPLAGPETAPRAPRSAGEIAYDELPAKPAGHVAHGRAGVEPSAIALAAWLHAVPAAKATPDVPCADDLLRVAWEELPGTDHTGAFVGPLGPAPTADTLAVNGIVVCSGSDWAFMGFQARYDAGRWDVIAVPNADAGEADKPEVTAPEPTATPSPSVTIDGRTFGAAIEGLAAYEPQRTCDGTAKPGTAALRNLLLKDNPGSRNLGIVTGCTVGGTSEHKEGRAFDWGVNITRPAEKAMADAFIAKLLATDEYGNKYALARRMGIMYLIWDNHIWGSYRASEGWRDYHGASTHRDHIHISMSWAGALGRTSFWSGNVIDVLLASSPTGGGGGASPTSTAHAARPASVTKRVAAPVASDPDRAARRAARDAERQRERDAEAARSTGDTPTSVDDWARHEAERRAQQAAEARQRADAAAELARSTTTTTRPTTTTTRPTTTTTRPSTTTTTARPATTTTTVHSTTSTTVHTTTTVPPATTTTTAHPATTTTIAHPTTTVPPATTTTAPHPTTTTAAPAPT
jgi:hypothetical protein